MQEIEVKILEIDREKIETRLTELGAEKSFDDELHAIFFDFADKSITRGGGLLRLRKEGKETVLTHKKMIAKTTAKIMEETETRVEDIQQMATILNHLGLEQTRETRKFRTQYEWGGAHIVIDVYQDALAAIPPFIEIEAPGQEIINKVVETLGFSPEDCKNWHTYDLIAHYQIDY